jgi:rhomboid protease GluP
MDSNLGLLVLSGIYGLFFFGRMWLISRAQDVSEWRLPAVAFFVVFGLALLVVPDSAGYVGAVAVLVLIIVPLQGLRLVSRLIWARRFGLARRLLMGLRVLHPTAQQHEEHDYYRALELLRAGDTEAAKRLITPLAQPGKRLAHSAQYLLFRTDWAWAACREWIEQGWAQQPTTRDDPHQSFAYARTLGELGELNAMWAAIDRNWETLSKSPYLSLSLLSAFAFSGDTNAVDKVLRGPLYLADDHTKTIWRAVAHFAAGKTPTAESLITTALATKPEAEARGLYERRLNAPPSVATGTLSTASQQAAARATKWLDEAVQVNTQYTKTPWLTYALILSTIAVFGVELARGSSTDLRILYALGAFLPTAILNEGEWWRLVASLFLHYGWVHLLANMLALNAIGPFVERTFGTLRFAITYFGAGIGAGLLMLAAYQANLTDRAFGLTLAVGASGAIMGLIGAYGAIVLGSWLRTRQVRWRSQLATVAVILGLQLLLDLSGTLQTSLPIHFGGAAIGFVVALLFGAVRTNSAATRAS